MPEKSIFSLDKSKFENIDSRLKPYLDGWKLVENYKGQQVEIPNMWESDIFPTKYFEVIKETSDPNYKPGGEEDETVLVMEAGWPGYDSEAIINLFVAGANVTNGANKVSAEINKMGGADMKLYWNNKFLTNFKQDVYEKISGGWWSSNYQKVTIEKAKVWIDDMSKI